MKTISDYLSADHSRCDGLFEQLEGSVGVAKWEQADVDFERFHQALKRHFAMEENVLFPVFEKTTQNSTGPTSIMRLEHQQICEVISRLADSIGRRNRPDFFDHADTLRIMTQQHNSKEESILYFMTDRVLSGKANEIIAAMNTIGMPDAVSAIILIQ